MDHETTIAERDDEIERLKAENARLAAAVNLSLEANRPLPYPHETLGRLVREAWVNWAKEQPNPKPHWLLPFDELSDADKEADCRIGEHVARWTIVGDASMRSSQASKVYVTDQLRDLIAAGGEPSGLLAPTIELLERYIECRVGECEFVGLARIELARLRGLVERKE